MAFGKASVWLGSAVIAVAGLANCGDDGGDGDGGSSGSAGSSSGESGSSDKGGSDSGAGSPGETSAGSGHAAGTPGTGNGGNAGDGSAGTSGSAGAVGAEGGADGAGGAPSAGICGLPAPVGSCDDRGAELPSCVEYYQIDPTAAQFACESVETRTWTTGKACPTTELAGVCTFGAGDPPYQSNYYYEEDAGRQAGCEGADGTWCAP